MNIKEQKRENRKKKIEKYTRGINEKTLDKPKIQAHNKQRVKTDTKCLPRQFGHHTGTTWGYKEFYNGWVKRQDKPEIYDEKIGNRDKGKVL